MKSEALQALIAYRLQRAADTLVEARLMQKEGHWNACAMVNRPPFFHTWAASIRHEAIDQDTSRITYKFHFTARPRFLRFILEPVMQQIFLWETRKRLQALKVFFS